MSARESLIQLAIDDVNNGMLQKDAAAKYSIPKSTLSYRLRGGHNNHQAKISAQRLSPVQESFLVEWCLNEEATGRAPSRKQVVGFAQSILAEGADFRPLGARWLDRFLARQPAVKMKNSSSLEQARARSSTREAYEEFFRLLHCLLDKRKLSPANIANMDEHGLQEPESWAGRVIGCSLTKKTYITASDATTWASIIECGTVEGRRLPPCVIFTEASLQGQWFPPGFNLQTEFPGWKFHYSVTGWSNAKICLLWLKEIYLPSTTPKNKGDWRLLILDEHSSHTTSDFQYECFNNKVELLYLPSHISQKTQPLDRSVFSTLKNYFRQSTKALTHYSASATVNKQHFLICYKDASERGMQARNLIHGFRNTGIWPYDPARILDDPEAVVEDEVLPGTPPLPASPAQGPVRESFWTPQKSQDLRKHQQEARASLSQSDRLVRTLFDKAGKSLDNKNAELASLRAQVRHLQTEMEAFKPRTRKRVKESANSRFARIEDIIQAQEASEHPPKRRRQARTTAPGNLVQEAERLPVAGLERVHNASED